MPWRGPHPHPRVHRGVTFGELAARSRLLGSETQAGPVADFLEGGGDGMVGAWDGWIAVFFQKNYDFQQFREGRRMISCLDFRWD